MGNSDLFDSISFKCENVYRMPNSVDLRRYDFIMVSATAAKCVPHSLLERLRPGGCIVAPIRLAGNEQHFVRISRAVDGTCSQPVRLCQASFVSLVRTPDIEEDDSL